LEEFIIDVLSIPLTSLVGAGHGIHRKRLPSTDQDHIFELGVVAGPDRSPLRLGHRPIERPLLDLFLFIFSLAAGIFFLLKLLPFEPLLQSVV
jgi:hypothetical protein